MLARPIPYRPFLLAVALLVGACGDSGTPALRPNVLVLVMDTTRGDRVTVNGYRRPTTPRIQSFAADAVVFRNAWSPAGWTLPAHASLFTGLRPENHGVLRGNRLYLEKNVPTLAERFRDAGYRTSCLTNNDMLSPEFGLLRGFQRVDLRFLDPARPYPWARRTHEKALGWIDAAVQAGDPFFVFVNDMEPHFRYRPPVEYGRRFVIPGTPQHVVDQVWDMDAMALYAHNLGVSSIHPSLLRLMSDLYDGEIACLDDTIGDLLEGLRKRGILDRTIVVITSDHGENFGEHGFVDHSFSLHRSIRHIPLLIRYPPGFREGRVVDDVVRLEDVPPTLLELAGIEAPAGLDGASLLRDLGSRVARATLGPREALLDRVGPKLAPDRQFPHLRTRVRAVVDGRYHYLRYSDGREELYDLEADPLETRNLAPDSERHRELLARVRGLIPMW